MKVASSRSVLGEQLKPVACLKIEHVIENGICLAICFLLYIHKYMPNISMRPTNLIALGCRTHTRTTVQVGSTYPDSK
jgi:hypothetical protein